MAGTPLCSNPDLMEQSWSAVYIPGAALLTLPGAGVPTSGDDASGVPLPTLETLQVGKNTDQVCCGASRTKCLSICKARAR